MPADGAVPAAGAVPDDGAGTGLGPDPSEEELTFGVVTSVLPVDVEVLDDEVLDDDALAEADALALDDGELLFLGAGEGLVEDLLEVAGAAACVGAGLVQLGLGLGLVLAALFWLATPELRLLLALGDAVAVVLGAPAGLALGLTLVLGLLLALAEALALAVLLLLWLPLDDVAGAVVVAVALLDELASLSATAGCVDPDAHALGDLTAAALALPEPSATEGFGVTCEPPAVFFEGPLVMLKAEPMVSLTCTT